MVDRQRADYQADRKADVVGVQRWDGGEESWNIGGRRRLKIEEMERVRVDQVRRLSGVVSNTGQSRPQPARSLGNADKASMRCTVDHIFKMAFSRLLSPLRFTPVLSGYVSRLSAGTVHSIFPRCIEQIRLVFYARIFYTGLSDDCALNLSKVKII